MDLKITAVTSGAVKGEHGTRGNAVPLNIFWGRCSPKDVRTRGTVINYNNTLAFPIIGLQRNAKLYCKS